MLGLRAAMLAGLAVLAVAAPVVAAGSGASGASAPGVRVKIFVARTAGMLRSVRVASGVGYADFADFSRIISGASSSCGSGILLAQLDRTAKQFPTVRRTLYSFNGSTGAFYEWLQMEPPRV